MPFDDVYRRQVDLLVRTLPYVAEEKCFALKGGTAINLFVRELPRLSVDIDLTYLPIADRDKSLAEIDDALRRIGERIKSVMKGIRVTESTPATQQTINKLILRTPDRVQIKIEVAAPASLSPQSVMISGTAAGGATMIAVSTSDPASLSLL